MQDNRDEAIRVLTVERNELKQHCLRLQGQLDLLGYPPGHFYSPIVDTNDIRVTYAVRNRLASPSPPGIHLHPPQMSELLRRLSVHTRYFPFPRHPDKRFRFYFDNPFFGCHDASVFFSMLLEYRPRRVVEIGSGFSSRLLLDTNSLFFDGAINITLIDPALPADLRVEAGASVLQCHAQDVGFQVFDELEENDVLFVDSSHVSKTGSDVNFYALSVLPRLKPGVLVHIHDIFYPFEYLESWVLGEHRNWNETYLIQAILQNNQALDILYWNNYVYHYLADELQFRMPLCMENEGGSLWLRSNHAWAIF